MRAMWFLPRLKRQIESLRNQSMRVASAGSKLPAHVLRIVSRLELFSESKARA
jgi:hypothetical protein